MDNRHLTLKQIALFGILGGLTFAAKVVMAGLPNIEPVSLMVMLFAVTFGRKAVYPIYVYVAMEFFLYGLNTWSICYLYIWLVLAICAWLLRSMTHPLAWALLSGVPPGLGTPLRCVRPLLRRAVRPGGRGHRRL